MLSLSINQLPEECRSGWPHTTTWNVQKSQV
jgi:hypothetical protein